MENRPCLPAGGEQIRLTTPASTPYALSMPTEAGAEVPAQSIATNRKGSGATAQRYESGVVAEVNGEVHVNQERLHALKNARLIQKIKQFLDRAHDQDRIPKDKHEREKYFAEMVREWSSDAVKTALEGKT